MAYAASQAGGRLVAHLALATAAQAISTALSAADANTGGTGGTNTATQARKNFTACLIVMFNGIAANHVQVSEDGTGIRATVLAHGAGDPVDMNVTRPAGATVARAGTYRCIVPNSVPTIHTAIVPSVPARGTPVVLPPVHLHGQAAAASTLTPMPVPMRH